MKKRTQFLFAVILISVFNLSFAGNRQVYKIKASDAYKEARSRGFNFGVKWKSRLSKCVLKPSGSVIMLLAYGGRVIGSKCDFRLFASKLLAPGWKFKSFRGNGRNKRGRYGFSYLKSPRRNSRSLELIIRVWASASISRSKSRRLGAYHLQTLEIEGPKGANWKNAFR